MGFWTAITSIFRNGNAVEPQAAAAEPTLFRPHLRPPAVGVAGLPERVAIGPITGREDLVEELLQEVAKHRRVALQPHRREVPPSGVNRVLYHLAYAAVDRVKATAVLILRADTPLQLRFSMATLARVAGSSTSIRSGSDLATRENLFRHWLDRHSGWLLILEEVNDFKAAKAVEALIGAVPHGAFLVCGHHPTDTFGRTLPFDDLSVEASVKLLQEELGGDMRALGLTSEVLSELAGSVGGVTTALEAAAGALRQRRLPWFQVSSELAASRAWFHQHKSHFPSALTEMAGGLLRLNIVGLSPPATVLLRIACFGAAFPIPMWLLNRAEPNLRQALQQLTQNRFEEVDFPLQAAATELRDAMVARLSPESLDFNRLIVEFARASLLADAGDRPENTPAFWVAQLLELLEIGMAEAEILPSRWEDLRPHLEVIMAYAVAHGQTEATIPLAQRLGSYYRKAGLPERALEILQGALNHAAAGRRAHGASIVQLTAELALSWVDAGKPERAEPLLRKVLENNAQANRQRANALAELARIRHLQGDLPDALDLARQSLSVEQEISGREHPAIAPRLFTLGELLLAAGRLAEAQSVLQRAEEQFQQTDQGTTALATSCKLALARIDLAEKHDQAAEDRLMAVIQQLHSTQGRRGPDLTGPLSLLAKVRLDRGQWEAAETILIDLLALLQETHGEAHPSVTQALRNLAECNLYLERWRTAKGQLERDLRLEETLSGMESPNLYPVLDLLAQLYWANGKMAEMEIYLNRAWSIAHLHPESVPSMPERLLQRLIEVFPNHPPGQPLPEGSTVHIESIPQGHA